MQRYLYNKLTSKKKRLSKTQYCFYRWLVSVFQDKEKYNIVSNRIMSWIFGVSDVSIKNKLHLSLNDLFIINDITVIVTDDPDTWYGPSGIGLQELCNATKLRIHIIPDKWTPRKDIREQFILNKPIR